MYNRITVFIRLITNTESCFFIDSLFTGSVLEQFWKCFAGDSTIF